MPILGAVISTWLLVSGHIDLPYECHVSPEVDGYLGPHDASVVAYNAVVLLGLAHGFEYVTVRRPCLVMQTVTIKPIEIKLEGRMPEQPLIPMSDYAQMLSLPL